MDKKLRRRPGRPPRNAEADQQTAHKILYAAAEMFMEKGYEQVSLEQIAIECGVTKASIYYYYPNKADLFTHSVVRILGHAADTTLEMLNGPGTLQERLIRIAEGHLTMNRSDFNSMLNEAKESLKEEQVKQIRGAEENIHSVMAEHFQAAAQKKELKPLSPVILSHSFSALLMLGNRPAIREHYSSVADAAKDIVNLFLKGAGPD